MLYLALKASGLNVSARKVIAQGRKLGIHVRTEEALEAIRFAVSGNAPENAPETGERFPDLGDRSSAFSLPYIGVSQAFSDVYGAFLRTAESVSGLLASSSPSPAPPPSLSPHLGYRSARARTYTREENTLRAETRQLVDDLLEKAERDNADAAIEAAS